MSNHTFQMIPAITAPINGATINIHSCARAAPPTKMAGPRLRAGFTEVPVIGMPTRWTSVRVRPIARPAKP